MLHIVRLIDVWKQFNTTDSARFANDSMFDGDAAVHKAFVSDTGNHRPFLP